MLHTALLNAGYPSNAFDIGYHMYWPSGSDPFYLANTADNLARKTYYNVNATPTFKCDGAAVSSWTTIATNIQNELTVPSPVWMDLFTQVNGNQITLTAKCVSNEVIGTGHVIQMMLMDRYDYLVSPNSMNNHYHALRKIAPTTSGQTFTANPGDTVTYTATFTIDPAWSQNNLDVCAFVQNNSTKAVLQARCEQVPGNFTGLTVTLTPSNPPIQIPAQGGSFVFTAQIHNGGSAAYNFDCWIKQQTPSGNWEGPLLGPVNVTVPAGNTVERVRTQNVPGSAAPGVYTYRGYVGYYVADARWDSSSFTYTKLSTSTGGPMVLDWSNTGESFDQWSVNSVGERPSAFALAGNYPNPFNPSTTIRYTLPEGAHVALNVYDVNGRLVAGLVNGWREMGTHEVTFDGSHLASGVYLYTLTAGSHTASGKMMLLK